MTSPSSSSLPIHWTDHVQLMLNSYAHWVKEELISRDGTPEQQAARVFGAQIVIVSHGTEDDPILNYGNQTALDLWQMDIPTLTKTPSRKTAEPMHREERADLLRRTTADGYVDDYRGIRISSQGQRFLIEKATVWNLITDNGSYAGQAATFDHWTFLDK